MSATVYCLLLFIGPFFNMFSLKNKARKAWIFVARKQKECRKTIALLSFSWRRKLSWLYANALWKCRKGKCSSCSFWLLFFVLPRVLLLNSCLLNGACQGDLTWKAVNFSDDWTITFCSMGRTAFCTTTPPPSRHATTLTTSVMLNVHRPMWEA